MVHASVRGILLFAAVVALSFAAFPGQVSPVGERDLQSASPEPAAPRAPEAHEAPRATPPAAAPAEAAPPAAGPAAS
ncbi:MAG TPA: hypothetical protein VFH78_12735, partial [Candidatus Thermoplasmatota archaeon]|nr:hypothetical protein [Candidatus Thermoplasmatota archaeon]